jgi:hypothetical protein
MPKETCVVGEGGVFGEQVGRERGRGGRRFWGSKEEKREEKGKC